MFKCTFLSKLFPICQFSWKVVFNALKLIFELKMNQETAYPRDLVKLSLVESVTVMNGHQKNLRMEVGFSSVHVKLAVM